ncbi:MAG: phytanoyl-CoA dioxygenase family protein [Chloroflexota bacterium]
MYRSDEIVSMDTRTKYIHQGEQAAYALGNRGPVQFDDDGSLSQQITAAYWQHGFYIFEDVVQAAELRRLEADLQGVLDRAPYTKDARVDAQGRPALGLDLAKPAFNFAKPLSDPLGGTDANNGRHPTRMTEYTPSADAPDYVIAQIIGPLQFMDSYLRLYCHPQLLAIAEQIHGPDFTPFNEVVFIKEPGLGASIAWHQDGTTHWNNPELDEGTHGFNFMAQLYGSTAANGVWVLPGSHKLGKIDIRAMVRDNNDSDQLPDAVPLVCQPGDVIMCNRQTLHASFANISSDKRVTFNIGFHRRKSVLNVRTWREGKDVFYDEAWIHERSRLIALGIDARRQFYPDETPFVYQPLQGEENQNRWNELARETILKNYNLRDIGI